MSIEIINPDGSGKNNPPDGWYCFAPEIPEGQKREWRGTAKAQVARFVRIALGKVGMNISEDESLNRVTKATALKLLRSGKSDWVRGVDMRPRSLAEHWKGTLAYGNIVAMERQGRSVLTTLNEAIRRASICAGCEKNEVVKKPALERAEDEVMSRKVSGRFTPYDTALGTCTACSCECRIIVHCANDALMLGNMTQKEWDKHPVHCWKRQLKA